MGRITPVILCGGTGSRLWPRSRAHKPKPFLPLLGTETLFDQALIRCSDRRYFEPPLVVTGKSHLEHARTDLAATQAARLIVEPTPKSTAAAVALAAHSLPADAVMLVCPSDHHIADIKTFVEVAREAADLARAGRLVCLGVEARTPETRFGYIHRGEPLEPHGFNVVEFFEKPDRARAAAFVLSREFSWNSGIFALQAGDYLSELAKYRPELAEAVARAHAKGVWDGELFFPHADAFLEIRAESIDYAVMENTERAAMIEADIGWSDIGNWNALYGARKQDEFGNSVRGPVELVDCNNVMVDSDGLRVSLVGLKDVIVVVDGDDVMITTSEAAHDVGKLATSRIR